MIRILVCDDDRKLCVSVKEALEKHYASAVQVEAETDAVKLLQDFRQGVWDNVDILFMDIRFECVNGIDVVKEIQDEHKCLKVVFITSYIDYATQIFKARPSEFLTKPVEDARLFEIVDKLTEEIEQENKECIFVQMRSRTIRVPTKDIQYAESDKRIVIIHTGEQQWEEHKKLSELEKELPENFLRCHHSFIVNMDEIEVFSSEGITLLNGEKIPVSKSRFRDARDKFFRYIGGLLD